MRYEIKLLGQLPEFDNFEYVEGDKLLKFSVERMGDPVKMSLKNIKYWEPPNEYEEISKEKKKIILKNIYDDLKINRYRNKEEVLQFNFSDASDKVDLNEILGDMKMTSGWTYAPEHMLHEKNWNAIDFGVYLNIRDYNNLPEEDKIKFHEFLLKDEKITEETIEEKLPQWGHKAVKITENYKISRLAKGFAIRKVEELKVSPNQNLFTYGLHALDMVLTPENQEEIKEILKQYKKISKEKNLSFDAFLSKNRPLNKLIEEI